MVDTGHHNYLERVKISCLHWKIKLDDGPESKQTTDEKVLIIMAIINESLMRILIIL